MQYGLHKFTPAFVNPGAKIDIHEIKQAREMVKLEMRELARIEHDRDNLPISRKNDHLILYLPMKPKIVVLLVLDKKFKKVKLRLITNVEQPPRQTRRLTRTKQKLLK